LVVNRLQQSEEIPIFVLRFDGSAINMPSIKSTMTTSDTASETKRANLLWLVFRSLYQAPAEQRKHLPTILRRRYAPVPYALLKARCLQNRGVFQSEDDILSALASSSDKLRVCELSELKMLTVGTRYRESGMIVVTTRERYTTQSADPFK
jgi:hypothetical protein